MTRGSVAVMLAATVEGAVAAQEAYRLAGNAAAAFVVVCFGRFTTRDAQPMGMVCWLELSTEPVPTRRRIGRREAPGHVRDVLLRRTVSARFARAAWRDARVRGLLVDAQVVVALDAESVPLAWRAGRRNRSAQLVEGLQAGLRLLHRL
ncbi:hypothetical protein IM660_14020 [Ruania alkalisoli]|uniref:Uncharacterized protein n=1 Tax=Ruania alkalisoli TaxID=2779775 RepID=A0A7M1SQQ2_9MICO|nr:hypothetical protein [Ruania alkalisoli]QOR69771.1 hypothetical protein IM660_14020 [Ruania alkalisoli]